MDAGRRQLVCASENTAKSYSTLDLILRNAFENNTKTQMNNMTESDCIDGQCVTICAARSCQSTVGVKLHGRVDGRAHRRHRSRAMAFSKLAFYELKLMLNVSLKTSAFMNACLYWCVCACLCVQSISAVSGSAERENWLNDSNQMVAGSRESSAAEMFCSFQFGLWPGVRASSHTRCHAFSLFDPIKCNIHVWVWAIYGFAFAFTTCSRHTVGRARTEKKKLKLEKIPLFFLVKWIRGECGGARTQDSSFRCKIG